MPPWWVLVLVFILWSSGVAQPLLIQLLQYDGVGKKFSLLYMLPNYVGMSLLLLVPAKFREHTTGAVVKQGSGSTTVERELPRTSASAVAPAEDALDERTTPTMLGVFNTQPRWIRVLCVAALDVFSFSGCFLGMHLCGSGIYTVIYSSVTTNTAVLSFFFLRKQLSVAQWAGCVIVTAGLAVSAVGDVSGGKTVVIGAVIVLLGTIMHSFMYVANEAVMGRSADPLPPVRLCGLVGLFGLFVIGFWQLVWTIPKWSDQVTEPMAEQGTHTGFALVLYFTLTVMDLLHAGAFYVLLGYVGSVTTGVLKGATAITVFLFSALCFCSQEHSAQCFSWAKGVSLVLVVIGVLVYSIGTHSIQAVQATPGRQTSSSSSGDEAARALLDPRSYK